MVGNTNISINKGLQTCEKKFRNTVFHDTVKGVEKLKTYF